MARRAVLQPSRWLLRTRLIVVLVGLLAAICVLLGLVSTVALQHFLVGRLDTQLIAASDRSGDAGRPGPGGQPRPGDTDTGARFLLAPLLARLDEGRPLEREPVDLTSVVIDAVSDASVAGPQHSWRLDLPDQPVEVLGDRARLHQVLANLLANARSHTPVGSTVTTSVEATSGEVVLTVLDDGPGLPADLVPRVFERFTRGDTSRARAGGGGSGLGLGIVDAIVAAHGGSVEVTSRTGQTAFRIRLTSASGVAASYA